MALVDYSDAEIGAMVRQAARGREFELEEALHTRNSLADFLDDVGLDWLGGLVRGVVQIWNEVTSLFREIFA